MTGVIVKLTNVSKIIHGVKMSVGKMVFDQKAWNRFVSPIPNHDTNKAIDIVDTLNYKKLLHNTNKASMILLIERL
jgi:hypothetical protein